MRRWLTMQVDSKGRGLRTWQLTYAVDRAELAEGWSKFWGGETSRGRALTWGAVEREGTLRLRESHSWDRKWHTVWCVVRGTLALFYTSKSDAAGAYAVAQRQGPLLGGAKFGSLDLSHLAVKPAAGGKGDLEVICGGWEIRLQAAGWNEARAWSKALSSCAGGAHASGRRQREQERERAAAAAGGGAVVELYVPASQPHTSLGLSLGRIFSQSLGLEYLTVAEIRSDTAAACCRNHNGVALTVGMVLHSIDEEIVTGTKLTEAASPTFLRSQSSLVGSSSSSVLAVNSGGSTFGSSFGGGDRSSEGANTTAALHPHGSTISDGELNSILERRPLQLTFVANPTQQLLRPLTMEERSLAEVEDAPGAVEDRLVAALSHTQQQKLREHTGGKVDSNLESARALSQAMATIDLDGNGILSREEIKAWLTAQGIQPATDRYVDALLALYGSNGDGGIDVRELEKLRKDRALILPVTSASNTATPERRLAALDPDSGFRLSRGENGNSYHKSYANSVTNSSSEWDSISSYTAASALSVRQSRADTGSSPTDGKPLQRAMSRAGPRVWAAMGREEQKRAVELELQQDELVQLVSSTCRCDALAKLRLFLLTVYVCNLTGGTAIATILSCRCHVDTTTTPGSVGAIGH